MFFLLRFHLFYYSNGNNVKDKKHAKDTMLVIDTRGKQAAAVVEKTPIEEDADVEQDPLELAIRTKSVNVLESNPALILIIFHSGGEVLYWTGAVKFHISSHRCQDNNKHQIFFL